MKKHLIIVKFISEQNFVQFYEQFITGQVFLPATNFLPDQSHILLKVIIPRIEDAFLINGFVDSNLTDTQNSSAMTVDISETAKTVIPQMNRILSENKFYHDALDLPEHPDTNESAPVPDELNGIEIELDLAENELIILENDYHSKDTGSLPKDDAPPMKDDWNDDLSNLKMEYESDDSPLKVDPANQSESALLKDEPASDFQLQKDSDEIQNEDFSEQKLDVPCEFEFLKDDEIASDKVSIDTNVMDKDTPDTDKEVHTVAHIENMDFKGVLFEDLKEMIDQGEFEFEVEKQADLTVKKIPVKKDLTTEERQRAEPIGQFFMNLTKAMLRSGYYASGHPGIQSAKAGLYDEFINVLGDQREIMITNQSSRDSTDLMLTGILDEPVSIRVLVGPGVADLFVPKLSEYCERKNLLSFALKKDIQTDHFYQFIDIMSDPQVDNQKDKDAGTYLTNAFIEHGITDISTVFVDDMVKLETDLPWRVEMAIHRLAKDLKIMPMFKGVSKDAIKKMKLQTVQDIIRPLKHPAYLNDFLVNCYIIAKYVKSMPSKEIEEIVVNAFSIKLLLPTSQFTFKELISLKALKKEHPDNEMIKRRFVGIKRILKLISRRVVVEKESGAQNFLEQLYRNKILTFHELPVDVQYIINTMKMADDIRDNFEKYENGFDNIRNPGDALVYLKCFRRTLPFIIESGNWKLVAGISGLVKKVSLRKPVNTDNVHKGLKIVRSDLVEDFSESALFKSIDVSERPIVFIFKDITDKIIDAYENSSSKQRQVIDSVLDDLGSFGVDIISRMLSDSDNRDVRKLSFDMLMKKGIQAKKWSVSILQDMSRPWYIHRNALMILGKVGYSEDDFAYIRQFLDHSNPKIREEGIKAAVALKPHDGESIILKAINDEDPKVSWRAMRSLPEFAPISESTMNTLLNIISQTKHDDKASAEKHMSQTVHIITAINAMPHIPFSRKVETEIIELLKSISGESKSIWHRVKKAIGSNHETPLLKVAIPLLGKIGSNPSKSFLKKKIRTHPDLSEIINKALQNIESSK
jgi:hypothetical protein